MPSVIRNLSYSWLPKGEGEKGPGLFSNSNSHDAEPTYLSTLSNLFVRSGAWVAARGNTVYGNSGAANTTSMEIFNFYTGVAQTLTSKLIGYQPGSTRVRNITDGTNIVTGMTGLGRMTFASIKNRLFMANGNDSPLISADAATSYSWGVQPPATNLTYNIGKAFTGTATSSNGGATLTWNTGDKFPAFSPATTQTITLNGTIYVNALVSWTSPTVLVTTGLAVGGPWNFSMGQTVFSGVTKVPTGAPPSPNVGPRVSGDPFQIVGVNQVAPNNPMYFDNLIDSGHKFVVGSITDGLNLILTTNWTAAQELNAPFQINNGPLTWLGQLSGYQYAYSYYDPTTGHVSSISPILNVSDGEPFNNLVSINIKNIVTTADARFTRIILWRSAKTGSDLLPLALLPNTGGPLSYMDWCFDDTRRGTDSYVKVVVGDSAAQPGKLIAAVENTPPPVDLNNISYWDGRFWGSSNSQIGILFYSARNASSANTGTGDITVGIGEESWPLRFTLNVPGTDGRITGTRVVGRNLFILTDLSIYQVVGSSAGSYALYKVTSRGAGTSHFATCEIPGTDINAGGDVLAYLGNDARVHFLFANSGDYPQSYPIQDLLNTALTSAVPKSSAANLGVMHTPDASYLVVQTIAAGADNYTFLFDLDRKIWFQLAPTNYPSNCFVEGLVSGVLTAFAASASSTNVYKFLDPASVSLPSGCTIASHQITPPGLERKQWKDFQSLEIYTNEPTAFNSVQVTVDSAAPVTLTRVDTIDTRISALYGSDDYTPGSFYVHIYVPQGKVMRGRVFLWSALWNPSIVGSSVYEVRSLHTYEDATQNAGNV